MNALDNKRRAQQIFKCQNKGVSDVRPRRLLNDVCTGRKLGMLKRSMPLGASCVKQAYYCRRGIVGIVEAQAQHQGDCQGY